MSGISRRPMIDFCNKSIGWLFCIHILAYCGCYSLLVKLSIIYLLWIVSPRHHSPLAYSCRIGFFLAAFKPASTVIVVSFGLSINWKWVLRFPNLSKWIGICIPQQEDSPHRMSLSECGRKSGWLGAFFGNFLPVLWNFWPHLLLVLSCWLFGFAEASACIGSFFSAHSWGGFYSALNGFSVLRFR